MDLRCVLAAAVALAAAEKEYTTATAQNIKFGIEDIEGFAWIVTDLDLDITVNALTDDECKSDMNTNTALAVLTSRLFLRATIK